MDGIASLFSIFIITYLLIIYYKKLFDMVNNEVANGDIAKPPPFKLKTMVEI